MGDALDREIKASSEDTTGFQPMRVSVPRLRRGETYDICVAAARPHATPGYIASVVVDYMTGMGWTHNLVNFYYEHDTDPRTTIEAFRVYASGKVTRP
jgi:hypothetical protein